MKVLFLAASNPYTQSSGADLRLRAFLEGASDHYQPHLICLAERTQVQEPGPDGIERLEETSFHGTNRMIRLCRSLLVGVPDLALRSRSRGMAIAVHRRLITDDFAAVHISGLQMGYLANVFWETLQSEPVRPALLLDELNAEHVVHQRMALVDVKRGRFPQALHSAIQQRLLRDYETQILGDTDTVICPTFDDGRYLQKLAPSSRVEVVPSGVDTDGYLGIPAAPDRPIAVFVADQTYRPNRQAVDWLVATIGPLVWKVLPETEFVVVGRGYRPSIVMRGDGAIRYTGHVSDVREVLATSKVVLAPLLAGGGMKLKVLEGMAAGRPVLTTSIGATGIDATHNRHLVIADGSAAYAGALIELLADTRRARAIGTAARSCVTQQYSSAIVAARYVEVLQGAIERQRVTS